MQICFHKLFIQNNLPLLVEHLSLAISLDCIGRRLSCMGESEIVEVIWKLGEHQPLDLYKFKEDDLLEVGNMVAEVAAGLTSPIF